MDIDELTAPAEDTASAPRVSRRQLAQQAITLAMQSRWDEAAEVNQRIVNLLPDDAEACNRLGKAHTELGRITQAREAYQLALTADPANLIAQRNLDRLSRISDAEAADLTRRASEKLDPRFFTEETGKTGVTILENPPAAELLATLTAGDRVLLEEREGRLVAAAVDGTVIGYVEERLAARLLRLKQTGNEYQAGIVGVDGQEVRIIIRETAQSPQNAGRISFPSRTSAESLPRPYLREGLIRRTPSGDEEEEDDLDTDAQDETMDDDDDDSGDFGFHDTTLDEG